MSIENLFTYKKNIATENKTKVAVLLFNWLLSYLSIEKSQFFIKLCIQ